VCCTHTVHNAASLALSVGFDVKYTLRTVVAVADQFAVTDPDVRFEPLLRPVRRRARQPGRRAQARLIA
jgi:hypothetical protein